VPDDFVCSSGRDFNAHTQYAETGMVDEAATFTADHVLAALSPATPPQAPGPVVPPRAPAPVAPPQARAPRSTTTAGTGPRSAAAASTGSRATAAIVCARP